MNNFRTEHDTMGEVLVPTSALYGAQTQRAIDNFSFSELRLPLRFIHALAHIKKAAAQTNFQLNTMLPLIAHNLLQSITLLSNACNQLADKAIASFTVNQNHIDQALTQNPILITALNARIGYEKAAAIAKIVYKDGRAIIDVAEEETQISRSELEDILNPKNLIGHKN